MNRPAGIETEYGLNCEAFPGEPDFPYEASKLIHAVVAPGAYRGWDYSNEDPYQDLRGTRASALARDPHDYAGSTHLSDRMSKAELLANTVLPNGARLYNDHNHVEYCTDACMTVLDVVAQDRAGERVLWDAERARNRQIQTGHVRLVKNNTDYHGRSYGCHENYLTTREVEVDRLVDTLVPFLVTRQVFLGAGRTGIEGGDRWRLQMSQRADFFEEVVGINTTARRPIFNTRDEPHADRRKHRRLHVIAGDANRSDWATAMKVGTTALVIDLVEGGWRPPTNLRWPVQAIKAVSHATGLEPVVALDDGRSVSALDVQRWYLDGAERSRGTDEETIWILDEWAQVLADLSRDPPAAADRVDWLAKQSLLAELRIELGADWNPSIARRIDFGYHLLDPALSMHHSLVEVGRMRRLVTDGEAEAARSESPSGTRAAVRADLLRKFGPSITAMEWDRVTIRRNGYDVSVRLDELVGPSVERLADAVRRANDAEQLLAALQKMGDA